MSDLAKWLIALASVAAAVMISYEWLDRPIAFYVHDHFSKTGPAIHLFVHFGLLSANLVGIILLPFGLRALTNRPLSYKYTVLLMSAVCLLVSEGMRPFVKHAFGRTWPDTFFPEYFYPSLIGNGEYGFFPFRTGYFSYGSFPSGQMSDVCAVLAVLWLCYPRWRQVYIVVALLAAAALILPDFHFLGDVIAGAFFGGSIGWMGVSFWRNASPARP